MRMFTTLLVATTFTVPAWTQTQTESLKFTPIDGTAADRAGVSVSVDSARAIVGASGGNGNAPNSGCAYVFDPTTGLQFLKLTASDGEALQEFGYSVGIDGSRAIVGAPNDDDGGTASGAAYLFNTLTGQQTAKLIASDGEEYAAFGHSVAIGNGIAVVGAPGDDDFGPGAGAVYLFDTSTGLELSKLHSLDAAQGDNFGWSVAISGRVAIIGAHYDDQNGQAAGAAYLFDVTTGMQAMKLLPGDGLPWDLFGQAVAIHGNIAVVGAEAGDGSVVNSGTAYVFDTNGGGQLAKLTAADGGAWDRFGSAVGVSDSYVIVGAYYNDGKAYLFELSSFSQVAKLLPSDGQILDSFGFSVAVSDTVALGGAPWDFTLGSTPMGACYAFDPLGQDNVGNSFCFGDGTGTACPCGNSGASGSGCGNSSGFGGASLGGVGNAEFSNDTFALQVQGAPGTTPGLILRGASQHVGGLGAPVGDGLLCVAAQTARSQVQVTSAGATVFTDFNGNPFGASSYGAGVPTNYQFWYRDPGNTCSGSGFNFSNAWTVTWMP